MNGMGDRQAWLQQLREQAEQMLDQGLKVAGLRYEEAKALSGRMELREDYCYQYEVAPWHLPRDASADGAGVGDSERKAAALFLDAGRRFTEVHDFERALVCLDVARSYSRRVSGAEAREIEVRAAHGTAYAYLTLMELTADKEQARAASELAARYFELEGFLTLKRGEVRESAAAYGAARFRYETASQLENAVWVGDKERECFEKLSDWTRAAEVLVDRARMLSTVTGPSSAHGVDAARALMDAGRLYAKVEREWERAAGVLVDGARETLKMLEGSASGAEGLRPIALESLREAGRLFERTGEFVKAAECHTLARGIPKRMPGIVFLCHASEDKPGVRQLYERLLDDGFDPWLDEEQLQPGIQWDEEITKAIRNAAAIVVCLSARSITRRGYVQKEVKRALDVADEQPEEVIFIIPARLEACDVPNRLAQWHRPAA